MNTLNSKTRFVLISFAITILSACGGGGGGSTSGNGSIKVTAITISPQYLSVPRGENPVQLKATITPANAANQAVVWTSSNNTIISVSTTGLVTANVDSGSATITATAQDGSQTSGSTIVTATPPPFCSNVTPCLRVTSDAAANGDGLSWATPLSGLQAALDQAKIQLAQTSNPPSAMRILLQHGIYRPSKTLRGMACDTSSTYSDCTFVMQNNVEIYGGFAGTENSLTDRAPNASTTSILDGLLNPSASVTACPFGDTNAKCSTTVINNAVALTASAILDGVVVRNGRNPDNTGGGMYNNNAAPTIRNVTFSGNSADRGGGIYNYQSSPLLTNVTFSGNTASDGGGGIYNYQSPSLVLTNVTFSGNVAASGGGLYNNSSFPLLTNATFLGNNATTAGSKSVANNGSSLPIFVNSVVWGDGVLNSNGTSYTAYSSLIQGVAASDTNGSVDGVMVTTAGIFGGSVLADNGNPFAQTVAIAASSPAANNGALVWKSGDDYYASTSSNVFKLTGTGTGKVTMLPAGATLISTGGANKNNTVTPTAGPPPIYPDIGAYQH